MRGWERVSLTDLARLARPALESTRPHKFHAEPCLVTPDGTLFTTNDIQTAELTTPHRLSGVGTLQERAARCGIHGIWFASTKEGRRYLQLHALEQHGAITDLRRQVPYDLAVISEVDGSRHVVGRLIVDFRYRRDGVEIAEDVKGATTLQLAKLKMKMLEAQYGIKVHEVRTLEG